MGRAPCCDKANVKKGPWSPEEDAKLKSYIEQHGTGGNWIALPQKIGLKRCGKSCRLRWLNYLRPNIKHGGFSEEEDNLICSLYISIGSRWSIIAAQLPGRTDNDIKNYWNTRLKKKLLGKHKKDHHHHHHHRGNNILRQGKGIKSDDKNANLMMIPQDNSLPYWPELPAAVSNIEYSNQEPRFNDHASIRKLLIKLGGRFSEDDNNDHDHEKPIVDEDMNVQFPMNMSVGNECFCSSDQIGHNHDYYNMEGSKNSTGLQFQMLQQGQSSNYHVHQLDGFEFLYGDDHMINDSRIAGGSLGADNMRGWTEMGSPPVISPASYEATVGMIQEASFGDGLRYSPVAPAAASGGRV